VKLITLEAIELATGMQFEKGEGVPPVKECGVEQPTSPSSFSN